KECHLARHVRGFLSNSHTRGRHTTASSCRSNEAVALTPNAAEKRPHSRLSSECSFRGAPQFDPRPTSADSPVPARSNQMKEKVRLIIPFWGMTYLRKLTNITIPALLAPNNLPAMLESFDVEVVLVTEQDLFPITQQMPSFRHL